MPPRLPWTKLLPGLIALSVVVLFALGVLVFAGVGKIKGETIRIYVLTDQARGLMGGSEVWLAGQKIGAVEKIGFRPPSADTMGRVVLSLRVKAKEAEFLRRNSPIKVGPGGTVMGQIVVALESGPPTSPGIRDGDTLSTRPVTPIAQATAKLEEATTQLPTLKSDAKAVMASVRDPNGTVGAVMSGGTTKGVARLRANVSRLRERMGGKSGGQSGPRSVMLHASRALARVDSIRALLGSERTSLGRFRRDSTLGRTISGVRDELAQIQLDLEQQQGTLYRLKSDSALMQSVAAAKREMGLLFDDVRRHPLRYLQF